MWVGVRAGEKGHECDGGGLFCSLGCFSGLFFKLKNEKVILACLQTRLILAERPDASTPCMYFHTCAAGCMRTLRLAQHSWKVCGSMSASSEGATGGREVGVEEEMLEAGELRHPFPLACVVRSKPLLAGSQAASCRARGTSSLHLLEVYD